MKLLAFCLAMYATVAPSFGEAQVAATYGQHTSEEFQLVVITDQYITQSIGDDTAYVRTLACDDAGGFAIINWKSVDSGGQILAHYSAGQYSYLDGVGGDLSKSGMLSYGVSAQEQAILKNTQYSIKGCVPPLRAPGRGPYANGTTLCQL